MFLALIVAMAATSNPVCEMVKESKVAAFSTDYKGTPFGSLVGYQIDLEGKPYIFVSGLSVHVKNIKKNPKASIMVFKEDKDDVFNSQRITFVGKMVKVENPEDLKKAYLEKYPTAELFATFGDFDFYRLEIEKIHCIKGFGEIEWIEPKDWVKQWKDSQ